MMIAAIFQPTSMSCLFHRWNLRFLRKHNLKLPSLTLTSNFSLWWFLTNQFTWRKNKTKLNKTRPISTYHLWLSLLNLILLFFNETVYITDLCIWINFGCTVLNFENIDFWVILWAVIRIYYIYSSIFNIFWIYSYIYVFLSEPQGEKNAYILELEILRNVIRKYLDR